MIIKKPDKQSILYLIIIVALAVFVCLGVVYYISRTEIEEVTFEKPGSGPGAMTKEEMIEAVYGLEYLDDDLLEIVKKHPETPVDIFLAISFDTEELRQLTNLRIPGTNIYISVPEESLEELLEEFGYRIRDYTKTKIPVLGQQTGYGEEPPGEEPPGEEPPGETGYGEEPPGEEPPGEEPPGEEPPGEEPPGETVEENVEEVEEIVDKIQEILRAIEAAKSVFTPEMQEVIDEADIFVIDNDDYVNRLNELIDELVEAGALDQEQADYLKGNWVPEIVGVVDSEGNIIINKDKVRDPVGIIVHEYAHVVDGPEHQYSSSPEWQFIYDSSLVNYALEEDSKVPKAKDAGFVSEYARSSPAEDFAETVRFYLETGGDPSKITDNLRSQELIQERFDYLEENGIVKPTTLEILLPFLSFNPARVQPAKIGSSSSGAVQDYKLMTSLAFNNRS